MAEQVADLFLTLSLITSPFSGALKGAIQDGESFSKAVGGWKGALTKLGFATYAAAGVVAVASIKMAADFQTNVTRLVTSAGETQSNLALVSNGVLNLAVATGTSTAQLTSGLYQIESAGYHGADGLNVLKAAAEGARAEGADLSDVGNALTTALTDYHLPASDAVAVTNQLVTTVGQGKLTMQALASSLHSVLPVAASANISLAQVAGAVATMTAQGTSADQATQDLANTIRQLQNPSLVAQKALAGIGLSSTDVSQQLGSKGLTGTLQEVYTAILDHMGPAGLVLLNTFNTSKQASASLKTELAALPTNVRDLAQALQDGSITTSAYSKGLKNLPVDQQTLGRQFEALLKTSDGFSQTLRSGSGAAVTFNAILAKVTGGATGMNTALALTGRNASTFQSNVDAVSKASQGAGSNINGWSTITSTFNFTLSQLRELVETTGIRIGEKLIPPVQKITEFFLHNKTAAEALGAVIGTLLVVALGYATVAVWEFTASLLANPVTYIILGIVALIVVIVLLATHWKQVWQAVKDVAADVWHFLEGVWKAIADAADLYWRYEIVDPIKLIWSGLSAFFQAAYRDVIEPIVSAWQTVARVTSDVWGGISSFFQTVYQDIADPIVTAWQAISHVTSEVWGGISAFFLKWWPLLLAIFLPPIALIWGIWHQTHTQIEAFARTVWSGILTFLSTTWGFIKGVALADWQLFRDAVIKPVEQAYRSIVSWFSLAAAWLAGKWQDVEKVAGEAWLLFLDAVVKPVEQAYTEIVSWFSSVASWLSGEWRDVEQTAASSWQSIYNAVLKPVIQAYQDVTSWFTRVGDSIKSKLDGAYQGVVNIGDQFADIGKNIVLGIVHGVENTGGQLIDSVKSLANNALSSVKSFLGINSPAKKYIEVGEASGDGVVVGTKNRIVAVATAAKNLAAAALSGFGSPQFAVSGPAPTLYGSGSGSFSASPGSLAVGPGSGSSSGFGGSGTPSVQNNIYIQGLISAEDLARTVQTATLQTGARNSTTYQSYQQSRGRTGA